jgi:hypothetical protein
MPEERKLGCLDILGEKRGEYLGVVGIEKGS